MGYVIIVQKLWSSIMPIKFKMLKMDGCATGGYVGGLGGICPNC